MSEAAKALALPAAFEWRGKAYKLSPVTLEIESYFAAALERRTAEGLARNAAHLGAAYPDNIRQFNDDIAAGEFEFSGRVGQAARCSRAGTRELVFLCLAELQPNFKRSQLAELSRDADKWTEVVTLLRQLQEPPKNGSGPAAPETDAGPPGGPPT